MDTVVSFNQMVLDDLGDSLQDTLDELRGQTRITESEIDDVIREIQRSLLQSDVEVDLVQDLSQNIKNRALDEDPPGGTTAREHVLRIVYEEMVDLVGESADLPLEEQTILLAGLQGSGKTTSAAKMAWWFSTKGLRPAVIQTDTFRPGAYDQAKELASRADIDFYGNPDSDDPVEIARTGLEETAEADVHIVDTAGRHALEDELIAEIKDIADVVDPDRSLLVLDGAIGQGAKDQAEQFDSAIGIDGVVITKLDGTAKGGGALTAVDRTGSSIAFLGTGEDIKDIERFDPDGFISRLLGMGDLKQLAERVERAMEGTGDEDDDWDPEDILKGDFTLRDMQRQMETMNNMGPLDQVMDMIPGFGGGSGLMDELPDDIMEVTEERMREFEIIMDSMTEEELEDPSRIGQSRITRIARGSGTSEDRVRELLEQHRTMERMLGQFQGMGDSDMQRMMKQMQGQGGMGGLGGGGGNGPF